jgi:hypothetical protein
MGLYLARLRGAAGVLAALASLALPACAHQIGKGAVSSAARKLEQGQAQSADDPSKQLARVMTQEAVAAAIAALYAPEERERLQQAVDEMVAREVASALRAATEVPPGERAAHGGPGVSPVAMAMAEAMRSGIETAIQQVILDLGGKGHGPLSPSIRGTGKQVSIAAAGSARETLTGRFPGCRGPDAVACMNQRLKATGQSAKDGFSKGLLDGIGWPFLVAALVIGLAVGIIGPSLSSLRRRRHTLRPRTT